VGLVEGNYRIFEEEERRKREAEKAENRKEAAEFFKLTQEVIDAILMKSKSFSTKDFRWIVLDKKELVGWRFFTGYVTDKLVTSDGRLVEQTGCSSPCSLYFPENLATAKNDHRNIDIMAERLFAIKPKKHWILKEDKKGFTKLFG